MSPLDWLFIFIFTVSVTAILAALAVAGLVLP